MAASSLNPWSASIASSPLLRNAVTHHGDDEWLLPQGSNVSSVTRPGTDLLPLVRVPDQGPSVRW